MAVLAASLGKIHKHIYKPLRWVALLQEVLLSDS